MFTNNNFTEQYLEEDMSNVVLINPFEVPKGKEDEALQMWKRAADFLRRQPGFISTKLHKTIEPNARFHLVNIAEWETVAHFQSAINNIEFQKIIAGTMEAYPHYPNFYQVIET